MYFSKLSGIALVALTALSSTSSFAAATTDGDAKPESAPKPDSKADSPQLSPLDQALLRQYIITQAYRNAHPGLLGRLGGLVNNLLGEVGVIGNNLLHSVGNAGDGVLVNLEDILGDVLHI
ncbi:hypothetical protein H4219_006055 [Mycoemilia scoparia]|uniref:Uncharacterized protein n=1 Tax=Mycoemilia scoparia TaxID=417184 RepID=A0A9W8DJS8_9FUNG|nr:hypothetical protein H4219_006055 [Mycoemilia scoparia]